MFRTTPIAAPLFRTLDFGSVLQKHWAANLVEGFGLRHQFHMIKYYGFDSTKSIRLETYSLFCFSQLFEGIHGHAMKEIAVIELDGGVVAALEDVRYLNLIPTGIGLGKDILASGRFDVHRNCTIKSYTHIVHPYIELRWPFNTKLTPPLSRLNFEEKSYCVPSNVSFV